MRAWIARARWQKRWRFRAFLAALKKAKAQAVVRMVGRIDRAAGEHWQAAAWFLERRRPEDWGSCRRDIAEHATSLNRRSGLPDWRSPWPAMRGLRRCARAPLAERRPTSRLRTPDSAGASIPPLPQPNGLRYHFGMALAVGTDAPSDRRPAR
jgi:hypothetical protein